MQLQEQLQAQEEHLQQAELLVQEGPVQEQEEQLQENVLDLEEHLQQEELQVQEDRHRTGGICGVLELGYDLIISSCRGPLGFRLRLGQCLVKG